MTVLHNLHEQKNHSVGTDSIHESMWDGKMFEFNDLMWSSYCEHKTKSTTSKHSNLQQFNRNKREPSMHSLFLLHYLLCVYFSIQIYSNHRLHFSNFFLSYSICHCQWNRKCRSLCAHSDYNTKNKMWFYANGWKVFIDHGVCVTWFPCRRRKNILQNQLEPSFHSSTHLFRSLVPFSYSFVLEFSSYVFARCVVFTFISGVLCLCLPIECIVYRAKTHLNSESHRQMWKKLKLNCTFVFSILLLSLVHILVQFSFFPYLRLLHFNCYACGKSFPLW